ncbi:hypothetical protein GQ472_05505 [archaeon]|nr:hypothetical protein [archaeon]
MTSKHEKLVKDYSEPHILRQSLQYFCDVPQIIEVYTEQSLREIFGIDSDKLPDICAITENDYIYVGEVKGKYLNNNVKKAQKQVIRYMKTIRDEGWNCTGFIIVGYYWELIEDTSMLLN